MLRAQYEMKKGPIGSLFHFNAFNAVRRASNSGTRGGHPEKRVVSVSAMRFCSKVVALHCCSVGPNACRISLMTSMSCTFTAACRSWSPFSNVSMLILMNSCQSAASSPKMDWKCWGLNSRDVVAFIGGEFGEQKVELFGHQGLGQNTIEAH